MSDLAHKRMTAEEFYAWLRSVEGRYELVDGEPLLMAGANNRHDRIVRNALVFLTLNLEGKPCQPFSADIFIKIPAGNRRQADVGVDCGKPDEESMDADAPTLVIEVLSQTNRTVDFQDKIEEYKTVPSMEYILLVDPHYPSVRVWRRNTGLSWVYDKLTGLDEILDLPLVGLRFPLATLYAGLSFQPRPVLVRTEEPEPSGEK
jgi:Uma2 family endonuclease